MYHFEYHTRKFDTEDNQDLQDYDDILNNPLCSVVEKRTEKLTTKEFSEGEVSSQNDRVILVVTWREKKLIS